MMSVSPFFRFLTDDGLVGDGTNFNMNVAADKFYAGPASGETWDIERVIFDIQDGGTTTYATFGALAALTNGCKLDVYRGGITGSSKIDLLDGHVIKTNGDFGAFCYDVEVRAAPGGGDDVVQVRWTFGKSGAPLKLNGGLGELLVFQTQDSLTGLSEFHAMIQGVRTA
jgi:hypothetical protein